MNETAPEVAAGPPGEVCSGWLGAQAGEGSGQQVPDERECLLKWGWLDGGRDKQKGSG